MTFLAVKPEGYFASEADERKLARFLRYGGETELRAPAGITFAVAPGPRGGQITLTILDMGTPGDAAHWGDGAGVFTDTLWAVVGSASAPLGSIMPVTHVLDMPEATWGLTVGVTVAAAAGAWAAPQVVTVPIPPPPPEGLGLYWPDDDTYWPDDETLWPGA